MALRLPQRTRNASAKTRISLAILHRAMKRMATTRWSQMDWRTTSRRRQRSPRSPALPTLLLRSGFEGLSCLRYSLVARSPSPIDSQLVVFASDIGVSIIRFRLKAPSLFQAVYERATTQRFFLLSRTRRDTPDCPEEVFELTGSTGNIYHVHIQKQPTCDCPHGRASNQCKHIVWCLKSILRAPEAYVYQLALLSSELRDIFANTPAPVDESGANPEKDKNRKAVDGDCPICFEEMRAGDADEPLVWCKAACGQNIVRPPNSIDLNQSTSGITAVYAPGSLTAS